MKSFAALLPLLFALSVFAEEIQLRSPDRKIVVTVTHEAGRLSYQVAKDQVELVRPSRLGMLLWDHGDQSRGLELLGKKSFKEDKIWKQVWGQQEWVRENYEGLRLSFRHNPSGMLFDVEFRVFDDGLGFRYLWPDQKQKSFRIQDELSEFKLRPRDRAWWIPAFGEIHYEYLYKNSPLEELNVIHTPATVELVTGHTLSIHEAKLVDFASMALKYHSDGLLRADLVPWADGTDAIVTVPHTSPWRTITIADHPKELVQSTLILNLNDPPVIKDTSWIETGKYVGVWWEMHLGLSTWHLGPQHGATTANTKRYIDFAAAHGLKGVLVEGWNVGWDRDWSRDFRFSEPYPDYDIAWLSDYARSRGVQLIGHHETGGGIGVYEEQMEEAYSFLRQNKIKALKTGYVGSRIDGKEWHYGQFGVRHYTKAMELGARNGIMMFVHEPIKPTGLERTWPNLMSSEGARGQEWDAWDEHGGNPPEHTTVLPFTRVLAGPMDFTPGTFELFNERRPQNRVNTTLAKQLALYIIIYSPWQMLSDLPENYLKHPEAFEFLKRVPTDWQKTVGLDARIGDYAVIARKKKGSDSWYLGAVTDENGRTLRVKLDFLDKDSWYKVRAWQDRRGANWMHAPYELETYETRVHANGDFDLHLAPGGGLVLELIKEGH